MKKALLSIIIIFQGIYCMAQEQLAFPFQGGKEVMSSFFKDSLTVSPEILQRKATGTVIFKFTADDKGKISKIVIYYADDAVLVPPIIEALKKSNHKWIIPDREKYNDFILTFSYSFNPPALESKTVKNEVYKYSMNHKPISSTDQIPLDRATLLPTVKVNYDVGP